MGPPFFSISASASLNGVGVRVMSSVLGRFGVLITIKSPVPCPPLSAPVPRVTGVRRADGFGADAETGVDMMAELFKNYKQR